MKIRYLILAAAFAAAAASVAQHQATTPEFSKVYSPEIPSKAKLCGETLDLDRVDLYEKLDRELSALVYSHGTTMLVLKRANRFFPEMATILRKNGVPEDLLYLACTESSLNPRAYSPAKAAGLWQFIASAAKEYGLEVNDEVDERYNIAKATEAACRYLKKARDKYGDWPSAMASYNGGMTRIAKELEAQGQDTSLDLYLTEETTRYPFRVLAYKTVFENPKKYGFMLRADQLYQPRDYKTVEVCGPVDSWSDWAKEHGISYSTLREENPWIRSKKLTNKLGKTYQVRIPSENSMSRSKAGTRTYNPAWVIK